MRLRMTLAACAAALAATVAARAADGTGLPSAETLRGLETSGRRIVSYHEAIAAATPKFEVDADAEVRPIVIDRNGWHVIFLVKGGEGRGWLMAADVGFNQKAGEVTTVQAYSSPKAAPAEALAAMGAINIVYAASAAYLKVAPPPFVESIFKEQNKSWTVYLQAKPDRTGAVRFGGDLVAQVSPDGKQVTEIHPLHREATAVPVPAKAAGAPTLHTHVEGDLPVETDVAAVVEHPTIAPHLVLTPRFMFRIDAEGTVTYLGPNAVPPAPAQPSAPPGGNAAPGAPGGGR